jgi:PAS domain S-box-containing protein
MALDHLLRGAYWPQSIYGALTVSDWRWLEHVGWVLFEDVFLSIACIRGVKEMWDIAERQAGQEEINKNVEHQVQERTVDLKASEGRFRALSASAPIGIFQTDVAGRTIYTNARWQTLAGLTFEESLGDGWARGLHPEDRGTIIAKWRAAMRDGIEFTSELRFQNKQGDIRWADARATAFFSEEGKPNGYVGTITDITERKRTEQERNRIFSLSRDLICVAGLDGYFKYLNPSWESELGFTDEELLASPITAFIHPEDVAPTIDQVRRLASGEEVQDFEIRCLCQDGSYKWILWSATPFISENVFYAFGKDITPRKWAEAEILLSKDAAEFANRELETLNRQLEQAIETADQMAATAKAANSAKSEFLANMSHEIRTPMNGIIGMTELTLDTELSLEQREYLGLIKISSDSLLNVINDILDFSRIEAGKLSLDSVDFELRESIEETMKTLAVRAHQTGLELVCHVWPDLPDVVVGDPMRLRQILVNLVGNAIKFTKQGEVAIEVSAESQSGDQVLAHFTVRDTGIGISPEKQTRIFESFTQADGSTTRQYGGTGLGLTISSQLVALMGGRMWVESAVGQGSTFHFTARFDVQRNPVKQLLLSENTDLAGLSVLAVDDNATNRRILEDMLTNWGMKPVVVEGGQAALMAMYQARETEKPFALALLDCHMPGMDGFMLAAEIKRRPGLAATPLIMLTSAGQTAEIYASGIAAYLTKPVKQSDLLKAIIRTLADTSQTTTWPAPPAQIIQGSKSLRILLAEDNVVNQRLAIRLLEKQGHIMSLAQNGHEADAALKAGGFDLVLMDIQMPEMNGLEVATLVRERELTTGGHLPIIAMTAHAMKGDRERCFEAGMDGYVSKPIQSAELFQAIARVIRAAKEAADQLPLGDRPLDVFDQAMALEQMGDEVDLLSELSTLFANDCPRRLVDIRQAITLGDSKQVERIAHTLKGTASNFGARATVAAARRLEEMGRSKDLAEAEAAYTALEIEVERLIAALTSYAAQHPCKTPGIGMQSTFPSASNRDAANI